MGAAGTFELENCRYCATQPAQPAQPSSPAWIPFALGWLPLAIAVALSLSTCGCSTTKQAEPVTLGGVTGPDAKHIKREWMRMANEFGAHGPILWDLLEDCEQRYVSSEGQTPHGPYHCSGIGCWHGVTKWERSGTYEWLWPRGRQQGLVAHETAHALLDMLQATGSIEPLSTMHPTWVTKKDGERINVPNVVAWKWPAFIDDNQTIEDPWTDLIDECGVGR